MSDEGLTEGGRIAFRVIGDFWVAMYALPDTLEGALELGRIAIRAVEDDDSIRDRFKDLMKDVVALALKDKAGVEVAAWREEKAGGDR